MAVLNISFFNCAQISQELQLIVPGQAPVEEKVITVKKSVQTVYTWLESVAHRLALLITVKAVAVFRRIVHFCRPERISRISRIGRAFVLTLAGGLRL